MSDTGREGFVTLVPAGGKLHEHAAELRSRDHALMHLSSLQAYFDALNRFDWNFEFSDDHSVWQDGIQTRDKLREDAELSDEHRALFKAFERDGKWWRVQERHWPANVQPKPARPS